MISICWS